MLAQVQQRTAAHNNAAAISQSRVRTAAKLAYYRLFARFYGWAGGFASVVMVNSTWTAGHIRTLWRVPERTHVVFPPCDTAALETLAIRSKLRRPWIVSVAQFRSACKEGAHDRGVILLPMTPPPTPRPVRALRAAQAREKPPAAAGGARAFFPACSVPARRRPPGPRWQ